MSKELDARFEKPLLIESPLLILSAQVLFGFAFRAAFQNLFQIRPVGRVLHIFPPWPEALFEENGVGIGRRMG